MDSTEPTIVARSTTALWIAAVAVAALGTWICYDSIPGINWILWTGTASLGLLWFTRGDASARRPVLIMTALAAVIAGGSAVSADPLMHAIILLSVLLLLAIAMLLSAAPSLLRVTAGFTIAAPIVALYNAFLAAVSRASEATHLVRSPRARAGVRGLAITVPVLVVFALLLAVADPTFALWRNTIRDLITNWDFLPRTIFFFALLGLVIGAYGYAAMSPEATTASSKPPGPQPQLWLGSAERLILLAGVNALLWLFMLIQLSYLFGNLPRLAGSGMTFAEYARRGFGELTIVAAASTLLIIGSERYGMRNARKKSLRILTFALIVAVLFLLGSAFHRVLLYEEAYGFTTARLYAQALMIIVGAGLLALSLEVASELEPGRLFRRVAVVATAVLIGLIYWNHEGWIARRNIDRFAATGKLDTAYLTRDLSPSAIPAIVDRLPSLPEPIRSDLHAAIERRYHGRHRMFVRRWFEWNLGRVRAKESLDKLGVALEIQAPRRSD